MVIRGVVFDIDDTLYDERDYVRSGFAAVTHAAGRSAAEEAAKDFVAPRRLDWLTIRIAHPRQLRHELEPSRDDHRPDTVIGAPDDLLRVLSRPDLLGGRATP